MRLDQVATRRLRRSSWDFRVGPAGFWSPELVGVWPEIREPYLLAQMPGRPALRTSAAQWGNEVPASLASVCISPHHREAYPLAAPGRGLRRPQIRDRLAPPPHRTILRPHGISLTWRRVPRGANLLTGSFGGSSRRAFVEDGVPVPASVRCAVAGT